MRRATRLLGTAAVILATAGLFAQAKTNFAGKWTLVPDPNAAAAPGGGGGGGRGRGGGGMGMEFTVAQDDKTMTVTRTTQAGEIKTVYNLDGSDSKNTMNFGGNSMDQVSKVKWDGAKLVITTSINMNGNPVETSQTWSLDGGNLVIEQAGRQGGPPTKTTYKKS
jgi:hypothetical protein